MPNNHPVVAKGKGLGDLLLRRDDRQLSKPGTGPVPTAEQIRRATNNALRDYTDEGDGYLVRAREELAQRKANLLGWLAVAFAVLSLFVSLIALKVASGTTDVRVKSIDEQVLKQIGQP